MKMHIGVDHESGLVHNAVDTAANVTDTHQTHMLLHGKEDSMRTGGGFTWVEKRQEMTS